MEKFRLLFFISVYLNSASAQWINIPNPPFPNYWGPFNPGVTATQMAVHVAADAKIYYSTYQWVSPHYQLSKIYKSDDFGNLNLKLSVEGNDNNFHTAITAPIHSYQDSTISARVSSDWGAFYYFTNNDFVAWQGIAGGGNSCFMGGDICSSQCVTLNYFYSTWHCSANDTLYFNRNLQSSPATLFKLKLPQYRVPNNSVDNAIAFINDSTGFFLTSSRINLNKMLLVKTVDFGNAWTAAYADSVNLFTSFSFPSANKGYLAKNNGNIFKTTNGGSSWSQINSPTNSQINVIRFANDTLGYIGGNGGFLAKTADGGQSWNIENSGTVSSIKDIYTFGNVAYFSTSNINDGLFKNSAKIQGLKENRAGKIEFDIFPNPSDGNITVNLPVSTNDTFSLRITDVLGREAYESFFKGSSSQIVDVKSLPDGIYMVNIKAGNNTASKKLVLRKD